MGKPQNVMLKPQSDIDLEVVKHTAGIVSWRVGGVHGCELVMGANFVSCVINLDIWNRACFQSTYVNSYEVLAKGSMRSEVKE